MPPAQDIPPIKKNSPRSDPLTGKGLAAGKTKRVKRRPVKARDGSILISRAYRIKIM